MRTVEVSDLREHLSEHLRSVKSGEEVLVCERDEPVARMVPPLLEGLSAEDRLLIAQGSLTAPLRRRQAQEVLPKPPGNISDEVMAQVWREERAGR